VCGCWHTNSSGLLSTSVHSLHVACAAAQVAASAGVKLSEADAALKALAYDSLGNLEVSLQAFEYHPPAPCALTPCMSMASMW
jgi:hypothetical protein